MNVWRVVLAIVTFAMVASAASADPPVHFAKVNGEDAEFEEAASGNGVDVTIWQPVYDSTTGKDEIQMEFSNFGSWSARESFITLSVTYSSLDEEEEVIEESTSYHTIRDLDAMEEQASGCVDDDGCSSQSLNECHLGSCRRVTPCPAFGFDVCLAAIADCSPWLAEEECSCTIKSAPTCWTYGTIAIYIEMPRCQIGAAYCRVDLAIAKI